MLDVALDRPWALASAPQHQGPLPPMSDIRERCGG